MLGTINTAVLLASSLTTALATVKTVLIGLVFMHLQHEPPLVRVFSVSGVFRAAILLVFIASDYVSRNAVTPAGLHEAAKSRPTADQRVEPKPS